MKNQIILSNSTFYTFIFGTPYTTEDKPCTDVEEFDKHQSKTQERLSLQLWIEIFLHISSEAKESLKQEFSMAYQTTARPTYLYMPYSVGFSKSRWKNLNRIR